MKKNKSASLTRRSFMHLAGLAALFAGGYRNVRASIKPHSPELFSDWDKLLEEVKEYPLLDALYSRRSRRFGWGMEIPHGPLKYKSQLPPTSLDPFERSMIVAAGLGISGWHHGIPHTTKQPGLCNYASRYTGRTFPSAAGIGNADMFYTQDDGTYFVTTRVPTDGQNWAETKMSAAEKLIQTIESHTQKISDERIDPPREAPHYSAHNFWNANVAGSTLFIPVGNVSEQMLAFLFIVAGSGYTVLDENNSSLKTKLKPFVDSGLISAKRKYPLSYMEQYVLTTCAVEMGTMGHNMSLSLQPLGLGGWFFSGVSPFSVMGAASNQGVPGLGFDFQKNKEWAIPNPIGLKGVYQSWSPPHYDDMHQAVAAYIELKFGSGGAYDPSSDGPFKDNQGTKSMASRPSIELIDCVGTIAQHIYDSYGKFPGTVPSIFVRYYTQAHRLETGFYDRFFKNGSYLSTHSRNVKRWLSKLALRS